MKLANFREEKLQTFMLQTWTPVWCTVENYNNQCCDPTPNLGTAIEMVSSFKGKRASYAPSPLLPPQGVHSFYSPRFWTAPGQNTPQDIQCPCGIPRFKGTHCPMGNEKWLQFKGCTIHQFTSRSRRGYPPLSFLSARLSARL